MDQDFVEYAALLVVGVLFALTGFSKLARALRGTGESRLQQNYDPQRPVDAMEPSGFGAMLGGVFALAVGLTSLYYAIAEHDQQKKARQISDFIAAAGKGDIKTVRETLATHADFVNAAEGGGQSLPIVNRPLNAAARGLHPDIVEFLLAHGADANATLSSNSTALHAAGRGAPQDDATASGRRTRIIELLLAHGARVNARTIRGRTPLLENALDSKASAQLLEHGAEVNAADDQGRTPLERAAGVSWDSSDAVRVLLDHGGNTRMGDRNGNTPLLAAITASNAPVIELLLSRGAPANAIDGGGETALHRAATYSTGAIRRLDTLALLCSSGVPADVRNHSGRTAADIARARLQSTVSESSRSGIQAVEKFLSTEGPCETLAHMTPRPDKEQRTFAVAEFACKSGDDDGCARVAWCYDTGKGVKINRKRAAELYKPACDAGKMWTCFNLAILYASGDGVPKNRTMAATLYKKGCDDGDADACEQLRKLH